MVCYNFPSQSYGIRLIDENDSGMDLCLMSRDERIFRNNFSPLEIAAKTAIRAGIVLGSSAALYGLVQAAKYFELIK